ncbi:MAG: hypothetical protein ACJZ8J_00005, partial [Candidatus Pelagibacter sp.]
SDRDFDLIVFSASSINCKVFEGISDLIIILFLFVVTKLNFSPSLNFVNHLLHLKFHQYYNFLSLIIYNINYIKLKEII